MLNNWKRGQHVKVRPTDFLNPHVYDYIRAHNLHVLAGIVQENSGSTNEEHNDWADWGIRIEFLDPGVREVLLAQGFPRYTNEVQLKNITAGEIEPARPYTTNTPGDFPKRRQAHAG